MGAIYFRPFRLFYSRAVCRVNKRRTLVNLIGVVKSWRVLNVKLYSRKHTNHETGYSIPALE